MRSRSLNVRWFGVYVSRHERIVGGPLVWTLIVRIGRKKVIV